MQPPELSGHVQNPSPRPAVPLKKRGQSCPPIAIKSHRNGRQFAHQMHPNCTQTDPRLHSPIAWSDGPFQVGSHSRTIFGPAVRPHKPLGHAQSSSPLTLDSPSKKGDGKVTVLPPYDTQTGSNLPSDCTPNAPNCIQTCIPDCNFQGGVGTFLNLRSQSAARL